MRKSIIRVISVVLFIMLCSSVAYANTDGTELQVAQPAQLEIQLGPSWTGTEFQLRTDAGIYPGTITVDDTGVLRCEIGGSSQYIFSCVGLTQSPGTAPDESPEIPIAEPEQPEITPAVQNSSPMYLLAIVGIVVIIVFVCYKVRKTHHHKSSASQ